jgi:mRNA interferase MazF
LRFEPCINCAGDPTIRLTREVLVPFPFTDQSGVKKRPAVTVSSNLYHAGRRDLIILAITSQIRMPLSFGEALVADWRAAGLLKPSVFKPVLTTIE